MVLLENALAQPAIKRQPSIDAPRLQLTRISENLSRLLCTSIGKVVRKPLSEGCDWSSTKRTAHEPTVEEDRRGGGKASMGERVERTKVWGEKR